MKTTFIATLCGLTFLMVACSCASAKKINTLPVPTLDLQQYLGSWYEIARFDHCFERDMTNTTALYTLNTDGTVKVTNTGWRKGVKKTSVGKAKLTETPALLRVSFFGPFYSDYRVLMLNDDYTLALVGSKTDKYLWILSRTPAITQKDRSAVIAEAQRRGYDTADLIWVDQTENIRNF